MPRTKSIAGRLIKWILLSILSMCVLLVLFIAGVRSDILPVPIQMKEWVFAGTENLWGKNSGNEINNFFKKISKLTFWDDQQSHYLEQLEALDNSLVSNYLTTLKSRIHSLQNYSVIKKAMDGLIFELDKVDLDAFVQNVVTANGDIETLTLYKYNQDVKDFQALSQSLGNTSFESTTLSTYINKSTYNALITQSPILFVPLTDEYFYAITTTTGDKTEAIGLMGILFNYSMIVNIIQQIKYTSGFNFIYLDTHSFSHAYISKNENDLDNYYIANSLSDQFYFKENNSIIPDIGYKVLARQYQFDSMPTTPFVLYYGLLYPPNSFIAFVYFIIQLLVILAISILIILIIRKILYFLKKSRAKEHESLNKVIKENREYAISNVNQTMDLFEDIQESYAGQNQSIQSLNQTVESLNALENNMKNLLQQLENKERKRNKRRVKEADTSIFQPVAPESPGFQQKKAENTNDSIPTISASMTKKSYIDKEKTPAPKERISKTYKKSSTPSPFDIPPFPSRTERPQEISKTKSSFPGSAINTPKSEKPLSKADISVKPIEKPEALPSSESKKPNRKKLSLTAPTPKSESSEFTTIEPTNRESFNMKGYKRKRA